MPHPVFEQIMALKNLDLEALKVKYKEVFGVEEVLFNNRIFLWRRIAYKLQEETFGGLSKTAKEKIEALIQQYDPINNKALRPEVMSAGKEVVTLPSMRDKRLPIPGSIIYKNYKGRDIRVRVLDKGFEYNNKYFRTLSAITEEITDSHWNGYSFFNL